jgi:hypothetical protein
MKQIGLAFSFVHDTPSAINAIREIAVALRRNAILVKRNCIIHKTKAETSAKLAPLTATK